MFEIDIYHRDNSQTWLFFNQITSGKNLRLNNITKFSVNMSIWFMIFDFLDVGKWPWWCHQMETFSTLLALCAGNSPVTSEFLSQRPVTRSFDVFFDLRPNKRLSKQSWGLWCETPSHSLWCHRNAESVLAHADLCHGNAFCIIDIVRDSLMPLILFMKEYYCIVLIFFVVGLNNLQIKQSICQLFEMLWCSSDVTLMKNVITV